MNTADYCIVVTLCNRPAYTMRVLDALAACDGIEGRPVAFCCEPVNKEVVMLAKAFREPRFIHVGQKKLGCNVNTYHALSTGFSEYDQVIALEDDTVPGRDFLRFCEWGLREYRDDKSVFSICGYQRTPADELTETRSVIREQWFTPWGWATWRDRWDSVRTQWPADDKQVSWDTVVDKVTRNGRYEIRPLVGRIQNIGGEGGAHVPSAEWHRAHHLNPLWIDTRHVEPVTHFREVPPTSTRALRAYHPC